MSFRRESDGGEIKNRKKKTMKKCRQNSGGFGFFAKTDDKGSSCSIQTDPSSSLIQIQTTDNTYQPSLQPPPTLLVTISPPTSEISNTSL